MRNLNLDQLEALREVVALGSFSAAAERLNLTQPAISLQIKQLEARLGIRLVERIGAGATACIHILPAALRELTVNYPDLEIVVTTGNTDEIVRAVDDNAL